MWASAIFVMTAILGFTIFDIDQDENTPSTNNHLLNQYDNGQKDNLTDLLCIRQ